ncbi:MAG: B12-binding domain-containing radical SAM protein [Acidobacteriaceae bacterium]|nr:B12-binding domain-containing radical SAM protein [Acidobacteriaceae bacterium]MBV9678180.1 B12-binding domain-containing radical SAM protein [Acidobacteriaceae bacterium]
MRVLLVHPPLLPAGEVTPPLGVCTLASWLQAVGHDVRVIDLDLELKVQNQSDRAYLDLFARSMLDFSPQVVGLTSMYSNSLQAEHLLRTAKKINSGTTTVAGGSHFGALGKQSLQRIPELDYVIEGEAEAAFAALLTGTSPIQIPRLHYRSDGELCANKPQPLMSLADLPAMWSTLSDVVQLERYCATIPASSPRRIIYIEAGRGCPFACTFCATAPFWEQRYRVKPVKRILDEIQYLYEEFKYDSFVLVHDLLTANAKFMSEFSDAMLASRLPVEWMANSRTDIRLRGLLPKLKAAGCWKLFYGVESASARIQKEIDKHLKTDEVTAAIQDLTDHRISATTSFVIGFPTETEKELSASVALGAKLKLKGVETVQFHRLRLFPPSRLSRSGLLGTFDVESLKVEYPFLQVPSEDLNAIQSDPEFFSGYWTPNSRAGTAEQLAQVEMFFHHAVALAPVTIAAAAQFIGSDLISVFYRALQNGQALKREDLDWETGDLFGNWKALQPLLKIWVEEFNLPNWQTETLRALMTYEGQRLGFITGKELQAALICGRAWAAFHSKLNLEEVLARLESGAPLTPDLLSSTAVILKRRSEGRFQAYTLAQERIVDLLQRQPDLTAILDE